ncbi:hypothetical protein PG994_000035 [Apiospora phragmitis]|uniref:Uncharacterized protein n=1 Tax=Apiospora phragmitis TaxID=2905665 RepID=A0ABR1X538_9PEZI
MGKSCHDFSPLHTQTKALIISVTSSTLDFFPIMATGFEVVGVILGAIPLVIEGIRAYKRIKKGMSRTCNTLILEIETEQTILRELYEGLYDEAEINGDRERKIEENVEHLLGNCSENFTRTAETMHGIIKELKEKLEMNPDGQTPDQPLFARLRLGGTEADFDELVARLRRKSEQLKAMIDLSQKRIAREPKSRKTKQASVIGVARQLLKNACSALSQAMKCTCPNPHKMNLRVETYSSQLLNHGDVEELANKIPIHVVVLFGNFGHHQSSPPWHWEELSLRKYDQLATPQANVNIQPLIAKAKRVRFTEKVESATTLFSMKGKTAQKSPNSGFTVATTPLVDGKLIVNICDDLCRKQCLPNTDYYGHIEDPSAGGKIKFTLSPLRYQPEQPVLHTHPEGCTCGPRENIT